jgi:putative transposase
MDSVHHIWCPLSSQEYQDLPDGAETTLTIRKKLWGNHFWSRGYFVDTVGVNEEIIRRYVRHQEKTEQTQEQQMELLE